MKQTGNCYARLDREFLGLQNDAKCKGLLCRVSDFLNGILPKTVKTHVITRDDILI